MQTYSLIRPWLLRLIAPHTGKRAMQSPTLEDPVLHARRLGPLFLAALAGLAVAIAIAGSAPAQTSNRARLKVGVEVLRFSAAGHRTTATGLITARLTDGSGHTTTA